MFINMIDPTGKVATRANEQLLCDYAMWRFRTTGVSGQTIRSDVSAINSFLWYYGVGVPLGRNCSERLQKVYRGIDRYRKEHGIGQDRSIRRALVNGILEPMLEYVPVNTQWGKTVRALLLFAKFTAFRCHNYVYTNTGEPVG